VRGEALDEVRHAFAVSSSYAICSVPAGTPSWSGNPGTCGDFATSSTVFPAAISFWTNASSPVK
jgi:hypothetical protein